MTESQVARLIRQAITFLYTGVIDKILPEHETITIISDREFDIEIEGETFRVSIDSYAKMIERRI